MEEREKQKLQT